MRDLCLFLVIYASYIIQFQLEPCLYFCNFLFILRFYEASDTHTPSPHTRPHRHSFPFDVQMIIPIRFKPFQRNLHISDNFVLTCIYVSATIMVVTETSNCDLQSHRVIC